MTRLRTAILVVVLAALAAAVAAGAADHPRLVSVETARCTECHDDLLTDRAVAHAPAIEDCTTCHEFSLDDDGTSVALTDSEPGLCLFCHDDKSAAVELELAAPHMPAADSCLTCHDPHASQLAGVLVAPVAELCGDCHALEELADSHDGQLTTAARCASCHEPHGSDNGHMLRAGRLHAPFADGSCEGCHRQPFGDRVRLRTRGERLCGACHAEFPQSPEGSVHAALDGERGRAGCLSCHDPHMSDQPRLLRRPGNALCGSCHEQIVTAAAASTGHEPAGEDCLSCHLAHTAEQPNLLIEASSEICAVCHDLAPARPTPAEPAADDLAAAHLGADLDRLDCLDCHTPHGAGHENLLAANLHPPLEDGCDSCHEAGHDGLAEGGTSDLCLYCHDDPAAGATVPHEAMELGACTDCHNAHASAQDKLVRAPGAGPCAECHDEQTAGPGEVAHGAIDLLGCRACHEPHGGRQARLLRGTGADLCLSCHAPRGTAAIDGAPMSTLLEHFTLTPEQVAAITPLSLSPDGTRDHPVDGHRVLGTATAEELASANVQTTFTGELTCLTCHDPHKGKTGKILRWDAASAFEACQACHIK